MPCYVKDTPTLGRMFICGDLGPQCICGDVAENLCDYPVGEGKTCDRDLCEACATEVAPDLHYCKPHHAMWKAYRESGGEGRVLQGVIPFKRP